MIIRSRFTKDDPDRVRHLLDTSNNKIVVERRDLDRNCSIDLGLALKGFSVTTALHARARNTVAHFKMSPDHPLGLPHILHSLEAIEKENGIAPDHPRKVIEHHKGNRPHHFHILYSAVHPATGLAISSKDNYARDEMVSRRLEIDFGSRIVPGPRIARNAADLRKRGRVADAEILEQYAPVRTTSKDDDNARQQGSRTGLAPAKFRALLLKAWHVGQRDGSFPRALAKSGMSVAIGDRHATLMVVHDASSNSLPLVKSLLLASGGSAEVSDEDLIALRNNAPSLREAVRKGLARAEHRSQRSLEREINRGLFEAAADGDLNSPFSGLRRAPADAASAGTRSLSLAEQRRAIRATYREAERIRRMRIERAFKSARIFQSRRLQKTALLLAASGVLLTGGGLALALGVGFSVRAAMQAQARQSRRLATHLIAQRPKPTLRQVVSPKPARQAPATISKTGAATPDERQPEQQDVAASVAPKAPAFDFNAVPKPHRALAAMALKQLSGGGGEIQLSALEVALGADQIRRLTDLSATGTKAQIKSLLSWDRQRSQDAFAAATVLRKAGVKDAAAKLDRIGRQRQVRERHQDRDRD